VLLAGRSSAAHATIAADLRWAGFDVIPVADGSELRDYFGVVLASRGRTAMPDVFVADVDLPGWKGLEALRALGALGLRIPTVAVVELGDVPAFAAASRLGAARIVENPTQAREIVDAVVSLWDGIRNHPCAS
jgi:FixJ family two-component response regulator